ncbi:BTR1 [Mytilus edulis]|uniref:SLC4A11 n=1 Tax=Mytilus edulis TaxID=6550 RepID=A0A8S3V335_MYTED|nr:BTR1 [Mytilus edulis]
MCNVSIQCTSISVGGGFDYDQNWICASISVGGVLTTQNYNVPVLSVGGGFDYQNWICAMLYQYICWRSISVGGGLTTTRTGYVQCIQCIQCTSISVGGGFDYDQNWIYVQSISVGGGFDYDQNWICAMEVYNVPVSVEKVLTTRTGYVQLYLLEEVLTTTRTGYVQCKYTMYQYICWRRFDYDQNWICAMASIPSIQTRHIGIARLKYPANLGISSEEVYFVIVVLTPIKERKCNCRLFQGIKEDLNRRLPHYISDYTDDFANHYNIPACNNSSSITTNTSVNVTTTIITVCERDVSLCYLILLLGTLWLGVTLYNFTKTMRIHPTITSEEFPENDASVYSTSVTTAIGFVWTRICTVSISENVLPSSNISADSFKTQSDPSSC